MRIPLICAALLLATATASPQTLINPTTQINWPKITGSGAPSAMCTSANYGQPYTDTTGNVDYTCGSAGWFIPAGGLSGMTSGQVGIAGGASTITSSKALAGAGPGIVTGPTTATANHVPVYTSTTGGQVDSGISISGLCQTSGTNCPSASGVTAFNTRTGSVTLTSGDVTTALTFTPLANIANNIGAGSGISFTGAGTTASPYAVSITGTPVGCTAVTFSSTPAIGLASSCVSITLTGNVSSSTATGGTIGQGYTLYLIQNGTGGRTFVPPTSFKGWPSDINRAVNGKTVCTISEFSDGNFYVKGCAWY